MFEPHIKDFKSPVSTIPPRGQTLDNKGFTPLAADDFERSEQPLQTQDVGTVAQNPAHTHLAIPSTARDPAFQAAFWSKVNKGSDCWEWTGNIRHGYGRIRLPGSRAQFRAHRLSYFLANDVDPGDMLVCHRCDNPKCVRPDHLFLGTDADNVADMISKGRNVTTSLVGENNPRAILDTAAARRVIELLGTRMTNKKIAAQCGVGHSMVSRIRVGRSWKALADEMGYVPKASRFAPKSGRTKCSITR